MTILPESEAPSGMFGVATVTVPGGFVIAWYQRGVTGVRIGPDGSGATPTLDVCGGSGSAQTPEYFRADRFEGPALTASTQGRILVSSCSIGGDQIRVRLLADDGSAIGANPQTMIATGEFMRPAATATRTGYLVAWLSWSDALHVWLPDVVQFIRLDDDAAPLAPIGHLVGDIEWVAVASNGETDILVTSAVGGIFVTPLGR